jgi:hypothetical protein
VFWEANITVAASNKTGIHTNRSERGQPTLKPMPTNATPIKYTLKITNVQVVPTQGVNNNTGRNVPINEPRVEIA